MLNLMVCAPAVAFDSSIAARSVQLPDPSSQILSPTLLSAVSSLLSTVMPSEKLLSEACTVGKVIKPRAIINNPLKVARPNT